jgi:hypothetical protein
MHDAEVREDIATREVGQSDRATHHRYNHPMIEAHQAAAEQVAALVRKAGGATGARRPSVSFLDPQVRLPRQLPRPDPPEGHRLPWSQIDRLGANVLVPRLQRAPRDDVHADA